MKKITILIVLALLCRNFQVSAQIDFTSLKIGDQVPEVILDHMLNYDSPSAKLSQFKGKLLILDFWATSCAPCIAQIPKLDSLQATFPKELSILSVTSERSSRIAAFLQKYNATHANPNRLPNVVEDKALRQLFPYSYIPHYVWIRPDGKVAAFTSAYYLTAEKISGFLKAGTLDSVPVKADIDLNKPLFASEFLPLNNLTRYQIFFKGRIEGTGSSYRERKYPMSIGICRTNETLADLFDACGYQLIPNYSPKNLIISAADTASFYYRKGNGREADWYHQNVYSIDYIIPRADAALLFTGLLAFIGESSGFKGEIVKRKVHHLTLRVTSTYQNPDSTSGYRNTLYQNPAGSLFNGPIDNFVSWFNERYPNWPIMLNKSGDTRRVTIRINKPIENLSQLIAILAKQGFELAESNEPINMLLIDHS